MFCWRAVEFCKEKPISAIKAVLVATTPKVNATVKMTVKVPLDRDLKEGPISTVLSQELKGKDISDKMVTTKYFPHPSMALNFFDTHVVKNTMTK